MTESDTQKRAFAYPACEEVLRMRRQHGATDASRRGHDSPTGICTAVIGSMTQAMKAQTTLAEAAIRASLSKISSSKAAGGCAYGVDFPCVQSGNVRIILERAGIRVREYLHN